MRRSIERELSPPSAWNTLATLAARVFLAPVPCQAESDVHSQPSSSSKTTINSKALEIPRVGLCVVQLYSSKVFAFPYHLHAGRLFLSSNHQQPGNREAAPLYRRSRYPFRSLAAVLLKDPHFYHCFIYSLFDNVLLLSHRSFTFPRFINSTFTPLSKFVTRFRLRSVPSEV